MSGEPKAPPPTGPSPRVKELEGKYAAVSSECMELHLRNEQLLKENIKLNKQLALAYAALNAAHLPLPPDPEEDPSEGGTRKRHRRHRRKRTSRIPRK